jgi:hypothetical protein
MTNIEYVYNEIKAYLSDSLNEPLNISLRHYTMNGKPKPKEARILFFGKTAVALKLNQNRYILIKDNYVYKLPDFKPILATENWSRKKFRDLDEIKPLFPLIARIYTDYAKQATTVKAYK